MNEGTVKRQERIAAIGGIIGAILGGTFGLFLGLEGKSGGVEILAGILFVAFIGYFAGLILGGIIAAPKENGTNL